MPRPPALALAILLALLAALSRGCGKPPAPPAAPVSNSISVVVSIPPLEGLVKPLLTRGGTIRTLVPPGRSEHGFEFTSADLAEMARADVIIYIGLGLEPQLESFLATHPDQHRRIVRFASLLDPQDDHAPGDPHLWLDPLLCEPLVLEAKAAIQAAYRGQRPLTPAELRANEQAAEAQIALLHALDDHARSALAPLKGQPLVTHHAAWQRLADRYGLEIAAVIRPIETGEPTPGAIAAAIDAARQRHARAIFVEPQFDRDAAERIARATGARVATIDPLGDGDYFKMMRANIDSIAAALAPAAPAP
jgi:zinc transport system substrate-binding protein